MRAEVTLLVEIVAKVSSCAHIPQSWDKKSYIGLTCTLYIQLNNQIFLQTLLKWLLLWHLPYGPVMYAELFKGMDGSPLLCEVCSSFKVIMASL